MPPLKNIYQAVDEQQALAQMEAKWGDKYALALAYWRRDWPRLSHMFQFGQHIRRLIYTTNTIEGVNRQLRKITKTKGTFSSEDALKKIDFLGHSKHPRKMEPFRSGLENHFSSTQNLFQRTHSFGFARLSVSTQFFEHTLGFWPAFAKKAKKTGQRMLPWPPCITPKNQMKTSLSYIDSPVGKSFCRAW